MTSDKGVIAALQIERDQLREALLHTDALLSLLRHRCAGSIPWGSIGIPAERELDVAIGRNRRLLGLPA